ncbi:MAG TPA: LysE family translocator [Ktedonobacterales bacterium]
MSIVDARFLAYVAVATLLIVTPGPDTALVTRNALRAGRGAASFTTLGIAVGSVVWAFASIFGATALLDASTTAFTIWKLVGAAYLGYLGLRTLIGVFRPGARRDAAPAVVSARQFGAGGAFRQGLLNNLLNPKAGAIFVTALPQFIKPDDTPVRLILMLLVYEALLLGWLTFYGSLVSRAGQSRFATRIRAGLQAITGVTLLALGARLAFERK